jgi:hypothetical protein
MKYTVQRPAIIWIETVVEAEDLDQALELADTKFQKGDYLEIEGTWEIDYGRFWVQDEFGKEDYELGK